MSGGEMDGGDCEMEVGMEGSEWGGEGEGNGDRCRKVRVGMWGGGEGIDDVFF